MSASFYGIAQRNIWEESRLCVRRRENVKSHRILQMFSWRFCIRHWSVCLYIADTNRLLTEVTVDTVTALHAISLLSFVLRESG